MRASSSGLPAKPRFERPNLPFPAKDMGGVPAVDSDGRILLTTPVGLLIGDKNGWQMVDRSVGLRGTVYSAFEDRQHSLWIGLAGRGLAQWLGYREWESYSTGSGLASDLVYEILPLNDGALLVGTEAGLFRGERRAVRHVVQGCRGPGGLCSAQRCAGRPMGTFGSGLRPEVRPASICELERRSGLARRRA